MLFTKTEHNRRQSQRAGASEPCLTSLQRNIPRKTNTPVIAHALAHTYTHARASSHFDHMVILSRMNMKNTALQNLGSFENRMGKLEIGKWHHPFHRHVYPHQTQDNAALFAESMRPSKLAADQHQTARNYSWGPRVLNGIVIHHRVVYLSSEGGTCTYNIHVILLHSGVVPHNRRYGHQFSIFKARTIAKKKGERESCRPRTKPTRLSPLGHPTIPADPHSCHCGAKSWDLRFAGRVCPLVSSISLLGPFVSGAGRGTHNTNHAHPQTTHIFFPPVQHYFCEQNYRTTTHAHCKAGEDWCATPGGHHRAAHQPVSHLL